LTLNNPDSPISGVGFPGSTLFGQLPVGADTIFFGITDAFPARGPVNYTLQTGNPFDPPEVILARGTVRTSLAVPEPGSTTLLLGGLVGVAVMWRRRLRAPHA
jgi:hypothetical protein